MEALRSRVELDPYDPELITDLEAFVTEELQSPSVYDFELNKVLLKLYQCYPERTNADVTVSILLKAVTRLPSMDLQASLYLVGKSLITTDERIVRVQSLQALVEAARFPHVWTMLREDGSGLFSSVNGFVDALRFCAVSMISNTFQDINSSTLVDFLDVPSAEDVAALLSSSQYTDLVEKVDTDAGVVHFKLRSENTVRPKQSTGSSLAFEDITRMIIAQRS